MRITGLVNKTMQDFLSDSSPAEPLLHSELNGYLIGTRKQLLSSQLEEVVKRVELFQSSRPLPVDKGVLGGRRAVLLTELPGIGRVAIKAYGRGGLLRYFIGTHFLRGGKVRAEGEFRVLELAAKAGVSVPEPILFLSKGKLFYKNWLVTREIPHHQTLAQVSLLNDDIGLALTHVLADQIFLLIKHGIFHIDLHPGNVLVDNEQNIYLIDFDKAYLYEGSKDKLKNLYLRRWRRAVIKHNLPEVLSEVMCLRLRMAFPEGEASSR